MGSKIFVSYMAIREQEKMLVYLAQWAQIKTQNLEKTQSKIKSRAQIGALLFDKALTTVSIEYFNYNNVFLKENIVELLKHIGINDYAIKLKKAKQPIFCLIYSLKLVKIKTLKIYI